MFKKYIVLLVSFSFSLSSFSQISKLSDRDWALETETMTYRLGIRGERLNSFYYGPRIEVDESESAYWNEYPEVPVRGVGAWNNPVVEAVFNDNVRDLDLKYSSSILQKEGNYDVLRIELKDAYYPLSVWACYRVLPEYNLIEKWVEVRNTGKRGDILIENLQSGSLWLPASWYELTHLAGYMGNEFHPQTTLITQGVNTIQSRDFKSFCSSYFAIRPKGERDEFYGDVWFGQLLYSGAWKVDFERLSDGALQIVGGIRFWDSWLNLEPGESFVTPKLCFGYTQNGSSGVSQTFATYTREVLQHGSKQRPVIYNGWYATGFDINEQQQLAVAKVAKEIGVEVFVIDDGWFKGRVNDRGGLGDWTVDKNKFPNGLNPLIKQINDMGMDFGIWVEPEMVNPNSDLYRAHPDWILHFPNRPITLGRNAAMLNLAREDVYQYLYNSLSSLLREHNIKYLKWDMNKPLAESGWPSAPKKKQREARIRYVENLYRLIDTLRKEFPHVLFEICASGGGRVDLGMLSRMDIVWPSDNIDPLDRIRIQYGYLSAFPANSMVSWTGDANRHFIKYPLEFHFDVAMSGVLGIGNDITKWGDSELKIAKDKIALYKEIRSLISTGTLYRLVSPFDSERAVLEYVSVDQQEAVLFCYNISEKVVGANYGKDRICFRGLKRDCIYQIVGSEQKYSGDYLMEIGIPYTLKGICKSQIIHVKAQ